MVVYCPPSSPYRDVAATISDARGEALVTSLDDVEGRVVYVNAPDAIRETELLELQKRLHERGPADGGFSVVTGRTPESAERFYFREQRETDAHSLLCRGREWDWFSYDDETDVLCNEDASVERLRAMSDEGLSSLSLFLSGWSIHLTLEDGYLCGFPTDVDDVRFEGMQPFCVDDGEQNCPLNGELIHADAIDADHVFLNSCATMLDNDPSGLPVHVGTGFLENAVTAIGGYRLADSIVQEVLLNYCLLRAGYDVIERCYLLNRNADAIGLKRHPYFPLGRPEVTVESPTESTGEVSIERGDETVVEVSNPAGHLLDVTIPLSEFEGGRADPYVRNLSESLADAPIYYTAFTEGDAVRVLVYTWGYFELDELRLGVSFAPSWKRRLEKAEIALDRAERHQRLGMLDQKANGQLNDFRNQIKAVSRNLFHVRYDLNAHDDVASGVESLTRAVENIRDRMVSHMRQKPFWRSKYSDRIYPHDPRPTEIACPVCDRGVFVVQLSDAFEKAERLQGNCPRCGKIFDVPDQSDPVSFPRLHGEFLGVTGVETVAIEFSNPMDVEMDALFYPWLKAREEVHRGNRQFTPDQAERTLAPGETATVEFEFDAAAVRPNDYWLSGYVFGNLETYVGSARLIIGPETGFRPEGDS